MKQTLCGIKSRISRSSKFSARICMVWAACLLTAASVIGQRNYYVKAGGNDNADGRSPATAWRSLNKINSINFAPGDSLLLEGGAVFSGPLLLDAMDGGRPGSPLVVSSFGKGKSIIDGADGNGVLATNISHVTITNLHVKGKGVTENHGSGIYFHSTMTGNFAYGIEVNHCIAEGFHNSGIYLGCAEGDLVKGYNGVRIMHCIATNNGEAGISSYGSSNGYHHKNIYIANCTAYGNRGILEKTNNHSGNGIVMGEVDSLLVEHCEAYDNGIDNRCTAGGPVGIWVWMCRNAVIQYCVSHNNHAGLNKDGGGFDIDGGSSNCVLQYNYSYGNDGAGYLLAEYGAPLPFAGNIVRFNISENDGRKNGYGGITLWGVNNEHKVINSQVYNNTVILNDAPVKDGKPSAVALDGNNFSGVIISNNILQVYKKQLLVRSAGSIADMQVKFLHNDYFSVKGKYHFKFGKRRLRSLKKWLAKNEQQESCEGKPAYLAVNPGFSTQPDGSKKFPAYCPSSQSLIRKAILDCTFTGLPVQAADARRLFPGACIQ